MDIGKKITSQVLKGTFIAGMSVYVAYNKYYYPEALQSIENEKEEEKEDILNINEMESNPNNVLQIQHNILF